MTPILLIIKKLLIRKDRLRQFCANRGSNTQNINYDNYELLSSVENNSQKIDKLKNVIQNLMVYEPERDENYKTNILYLITKLYNL